jgi:hypothetical protein
VLRFAGQWRHVTFKTGGKQKGEFFLIFHLALFLFADIPESIYTKRLPLEEQKTAENEARFS